MFLITKRERTMLEVRSDILREDVATQNTIRRGEETLSLILRDTSIDIYREDAGIKVFPDDEEVDERSKYLIKRLLIAYGYSVCWKGNTNQIVFCH